MSPNPIETDYRRYFLMQRIEEIKKMAESSLSNDSITTLTKLMEDVAEFWPLTSGIAESIQMFVEFVRKNYRTHSVGHLPAPQVGEIIKEWIKTKPATLGHLPLFTVDEQFIFGWLVVFALHEDYTPLKACVEFDPYRVGFVIRGVIRND